MKMVDPHIHLDSRPREELTLMAAAGITAVVTMTYYPHLNLPISAQTVLDYIERAMQFEVWRGKQELIDVYLGVAVNPVNIPPDSDRVLEALPRYLRSEKVVAIGEVGLEPGSQTCPDLARQRQVLRAQLKMAIESEKPIVFHTPHTEKLKWVEEYLELILVDKIEPSKVIIDHADGTVVKRITEAGCYAGITVQPWRGLTPQEAAKILKGSNLNKVLVDSDCNITMASDLLSVPKTALEMRKAGFSEDDVRKVILDNPARLFCLEIT
jgi:hypothetical protein